MPRLSDGLRVSRRAVLFSAVSVAPASRLLAGQFTPAQPKAPQAQPSTQPETQSQTTFSTDVKVVNVLATVRDKQGQIVRNLTKDDFTVEENGQPQPIRYFAQQSDLPLTLGLLVDTSGSERRMIPTERDASSTFVEQVLRPDRDKIFLIHFDREVELLQDLTSSREAIEKALAGLNSPQWSNRGGQSSGQGGGGYGGGNGGYGRQGGAYGGQRGGGTTLYDGIYLASNDVMKKQTGRKALILLTDGEDNGSKVSLAEAVSSAQRTDTLAYSVRIADDEGGMNRGLMGPGMGRHGGWGGPGRSGGYSNRPDGKKILQQISRETGGGYFEVSKKKTVDAIYAQIEEELRNQYSIGYTPQAPPSEGEYRKIQVTLKNKNYVVQAREGYYSGPHSSS